MCEQLLKAVFASRLLASVFEFYLKLAKIVTTETVTTDTFGKVSIILVLLVKNMQSITQNKITLVYNPSQLKVRNVILTLK